MKRKYIIGAIVTVIVLAAAAVSVYWYGTSKPRGNILTVGISPDYPPYEFIDEDGEYAGFTVDLAHLVAGRLGYHVEWKDVSFTVAIGALNEKKFDILCGAFSITPERLEVVDFTDPVFIGEMAILVREDFEADINEPKDIIQYSIGTQAGSVQYEYLTQWIDTGELNEEDVVLYERADLCFIDLVNGRIDTAFFDKAGISWYLKEYPVKIAFVFETGDKVGWPVRKGDPILNDLNRVINDLKEQGILDALADAWLGG